MPGGIKYGQHWLNVKFEKSLIRVPFRILTKEEEKFLSKNYRRIEKQVRGRVQAEEEVVRVYGTFVIERRAPWPRNPSAAFCSRIAITV